jgi:signal transduction histidine kinase
MEPVSRFVRPQDLVWLILFSALAAFGPERNQVTISFLIALAVVQVLEPRMGPVWSIGIKLVLCYGLIYYTKGIASSYFLILFLPVISAATALGLVGTAITCVLVCAEYLSFLLLVDWAHQTIEADQMAELVLRAAFFPAVAYLTQQLAEANRIEARKYQATAEQLAQANRSLQEAEAEMRRSERLAALGQLTAGLAHELRNPLGTIKTSAEMLRKNVGEENEVAREMAGFITTQVDRTNSLVTRFLDFARPLRIRRELTDLHLVLDRAVEQVRRSGSGVELYKNYSPDVRPMSIDGELMERVIYNLLSNAAEASPPQGAVTLKTRMADGWVEISVIDRGAGIEPKHMENIFNPFFTTKPSGVGLGLAIVAKIVDEHGGTMNVESHAGEGSVFRVLLPIK